jgi:signal transduction histidine kinase
VAALTAYCAELSNAHGVVMTCTADGDFESLAPDAALCFYRIAQEALRNVVAHAGASVATVRLRRVGESGELTIADDGKGFALAGADGSGKGLGLVSITERARLAGGTLSLVTEMNKGTELRARIPMGAPARRDVGGQVHVPVVPNRASDPEGEPVQSS